MRSRLQSPLLALALALTACNPAGARLAEGQRLETTGDAEGAMAKYESLITTWPDSPEAVTAKDAVAHLQAQAAVAEANGLQERGNYNGAISGYQKVISQWPESAAASSAQAALPALLCEGGEWGVYADGRWVGGERSHDDCQMRMARIVQYAAAFGMVGTAGISECECRGQKARAPVPVAAIAAVTPDPKPSEVAEPNTSALTQGDGKHPPVMPEPLREFPVPEGGRLTMGWTGSDHWVADYWVPNVEGQLDRYKEYLKGAGWTVTESYETSVYATRGKVQISVSVNPAGSTEPCIVLYLDEVPGCDEYDVELVILAAAKDKADASDKAAEFAEALKLPLDLCDGGCAPPGVIDWAQYGAKITVQTSDFFKGLTPGLKVVIAGAGTPGSLVDLLNRAQAVVPDAYLKRASARLCHGNFDE